MAMADASEGIADDADFQENANKAIQDEIFKQYQLDKQVYARHTPRNNNVF